MSHATLTTRTLHLGESWEIGFTMTRDGTALDLSAAGAVATLQLRKVGGSGAADTRGTDGVLGTDFRWPSSGLGDGSDGMVEFLWTQAQTAALEPGLYDAELIYEDTTASPPHKRLHARGSFKVDTPTTGSI